MMWRMPRRSSSSSTGTTKFSLLLVSLFLATDPLKASAFAATTTSVVTLRASNKVPILLSPLNIKNDKNKIMSTLRGGAVAAASATPPPATPTKKLRITAFDSLRFVLCVMIVLGHFISFANPSQTVLRFFSQHNTVPVSAFFLLSGYVSAYTSTENGARAASPKLLNTPKPQWIWSKIFGYYPLHLITLILFAPMFIYTDLSYNGPWTAVKNALLSGTLTQAWFPMTAEIWNAPTWYLSALTFATAVMPYALTVLATQSKSELRRSAVWLWLVTSLPKLAYCHDLNVWNVAEGIMSPKAHPNWAMFNLQRFSPLYMLSEILLGAVACRLVMLDGADDKDSKAPKVNASSTLLPFAAILGVMIARATGLVEVNDLLIRTIVIVPLVCRLFMGVHRSAVQGNVKGDLVTKVLSNKILVGLGGLAFPIYIVHGPIGQIFYKKLIAKALWGKVLKGPGYFGVYLMTTAFAAWIMQKLVLENKHVKQLSKMAVSKLSSWM